MTDATLPFGRLTPPYVAIGFRAESSSCNWAVVTRRDGQLLLIANDTIVMPRDYDEAQSLAWYRKRLTQSLDEYTPDIGGVRYPEPSARKPRHVTGAQARLRLEGVTLETLAARNTPVITGALSTISSEIGSKSAKKYLSQSDVRGIDLDGIPTNRREAIIVAIAAMEHAEKKGLRHGNQE